MDLEKIEDIIKILVDSEATEISVVKGTSSVEARKSKLAKEEVSSPASGAKATSNAEPAGDGSVRTIYSFMVGVFVSTNRNIAPGYKVKTGEVIGSVESMNLKTDIISDVDGVVEEVMVIDGMPVEYRQPLFKVKVS